TPREEEMLDNNRDQVVHQVQSLREVQQELKEVVGDKAILVVDTLGGGARLFRQGIEKLKGRGRAYDALADIYLQHMFGGEMPDNVVDMVRYFLGRDIKVVGHNIKDGRSDKDAEISAAIFTGSPADVSKAFSSEFVDKEIRQWAGITHGEVFKRASELYTEAAARNLPIMGICYGHQVMSKMRGGDVVRSAGRGEDGASLIESGEHTEMLVGVLDRAEGIAGSIASYHSEEVAPNPRQSAIILRSTEARPEMVHGLIHIADAEFTTDTKTDIALVRSLLADSKHVGLSVQGHPEETDQEKIITFAFTEDEKLFQETGGKIVTADILDILTRFLGKHGKFKK
ncbi:MAG: gamma-glutamyl-gamma-aminobutyrate hydrolase family protein, partial [Patescibacteria group bacterium]